MTTKYSDLVASSQEKIEADVDFQNSLADLSDEDKTNAISVKQEELIDAELEALDFKATKAEQIAQNQKIRAEKAEAEAKKPKVKPESVAPINDEMLSPKDYLAMTENKITSDDFDEVVRLKKVLGKTDIAETLKDKTAKLILEQRAEERRSAAAANTGNNRRSSSKPEGDSNLLKRADNYELAPDEMKGAAKAMIASVFGK